MTGTMFGNVYKNKKVLVTGHTGFKGAWLALWLVELGADVIGYSIGKPSEPCLFDSLKLSEQITHIIGDVRDEKALRKAIEDHKPEIVFHLAAQSLVRPSYNDPIFTYETNIMGTINVFEASRQTSSVRVIVNVTSDKCYENQELMRSYKETDPMGGYDPYSSSKGCSELVTSAYRRSFFSGTGGSSIALASVRAGNVIGGGDWGKDRLVPDCIRSLTKDMSITIRNPTAIRPWQFVLEPLSGYLSVGSLLIQKGQEYAEGWNFGPLEEDAIQVEAVVSEVLNQWGSGEFKIVCDAKLHEAKLLRLDINKSQSRLGWRPVYRWKDAVESTVKWYKSFYEGKDMHKYSVDQINDYVENAKKLELAWVV